jgi:DNA-binding GntR family transcriptional regulator
MYLAKAVQEHTDLLALIRTHAHADAVRMIEQHINSAYERLSRPI